MALQADVEPVRAGAVRVSVTLTAPAAAVAHVREVTAAAVRRHAGALHAALLTHRQTRVPGANTDTAMSYSVEVSYLEIYNEKVRTDARILLLC